MTNDTKAEQHFVAELLVPVFPTLRRTAPIHMVPPESRPKVGRPYPARFSVNSQA
jgi:hypothetical protein